MKPTEYIAGDRRGHAAHDIELEAMRDLFVDEALEGFDALPGNHADAVARLQKRLAARAARRRIWPRLAIAATLLAAVATTTLLTLHRPEQPADYPTVAVATPPADRPTQAAPDTPAQEPASKHSDKSAQIGEVPTAGAPQAAKNQLSRAVKQPASAPQTPAGSTAGTFAPDRPECWEELEESGPQLVDINDVVVIAYGTRDKNATTGAVGKQPGTEHQKPDKTLTGVPPAEMHGRETNGVGSMTTGEELTIIDGLALVDEKVPTDMPFLSAETMPTFQGGNLNTFRRWVDKRVRKPEIALTNGPIGRVVVSFVIDTTGGLGNIQVLQTPDRSLTAEAIRVLKTSPHWEPGRQGSHKVPVKFTMPVDFRRQN